MKRKIVWLLMSCLVVLSLVLVACAPAVTTTPTAPTAPTTPAAPTTPTTSTAPTATTAPGAEMVKDSLGRMVEKPRYGGVYTTVPSAGLTGFDPVFLSGTAQQVQIQTHDELVQLDWKRGPTGTNEISASFSLAPMTLKTGMLAESWEVPDDSTIIYHIRKGVHFALDPNSEASRLVGGRELTAADVAYSINRNFEDLPGSDSRIRNLPVEWPVSVTAPDKYTVVVKTNPGYAQNALLYTSDVTKIYPPEPVKKYGDLRDWKNNVGSGPFIMKDYVPGSTVTFVRNSNYWQHDLFFPENQLPYIDGVKYVYVTDKSTVMAGLRSGKIDGLHPQFLKFIAEDVKTLTQSNPEMKFRRVLSERPQAVNFVFRDPSQPWQDIRVRRALSMAIDREAVVRDYYVGDAEIHAAPIMPVSEFMPMYTPFNELPKSVQELYSYNPEKAKQLLTEAGYPKGFKINVDTSVREDVDLLSVVKFYWQKIGVEMTIVPREASVMTSLTNNNAVKEAGWTTRATQLPFKFDPFMDPGSGNWAAVNDQGAAEIRPFVMGNYMLNEAATWTPLKEQFVRIVEQSYYIAMPSPYNFRPYQPWLKGYSGEGVTGYSDFQGESKYLWIDQALKKKLGF